MEVRGHDKLLPGPVIVAAKHQAAWDTFAIISLMRDPALVMKAELLNWPIYGTFCRKFELIPFSENRPGGLAPDGARGAGQGGAKPGNRHFPGRHPDNPWGRSRYKPGLVFLYQDLKVPVCPLR